MYPLSPPVASSARGGGQPLDGKNFDLHPPPGREFLTQGKKDNYGP